jgi:hypothetical protein
MTSASTTVSRPAAASPPIVRAALTRIAALPRVYVPKEQADAHSTSAEALTTRKRERRIPFSPAKNAA